MKMLVIKIDFHFYTKRSFLQLEIKFLQNKKVYFFLCTKTRILFDINKIKEKKKEIDES